MKGPEEFTISMAPGNQSSPEEEGATFCTFHHVYHVRGIGETDRDACRAWEDATGRKAPPVVDAPRDGDQPLPTPGEGVDIQTLVVYDIAERRKVGIQRYGMALRPNNGRDALRDAYEEALDLAMYLRQAIAERDG